MRYYHAAASSGRLTQALGRTKLSLCKQAPCRHRGLVFASLLVLRCQLVWPAPFSPRALSAFAFLALALSFADFAWGFDPLGLNSNWSDVETSAVLAAFAVFFNLIGNGIYQLIARYGPPDA